MDRWRAGFVAAVWAGATALAVWYVARFGSRLPMLDDFRFLWVVLNPDWPTRDGLWGLHNDHRLPLPIGFNWAVTRALGFGLRKQMFVNLALMSALAAGLVWAARKARGRAAASDAAFPLAVLTIGQWETMLWAVQTAFVMPLVLAGTALGLVATLRGQLGPRRAAAVGACAALLPLCGMMGVIQAVPLAAWLFVAGAASFRAGGRAAGAVSHLGAAATAAVLYAYFAEYVRPPHVPRPEATWDAVRFAVLVLSSCWGPTADQCPDVPLPGGPVSALGLVTMAWLGLAVAWAARAAWRSAADRPAALGMGLILAGLAVLCGGIGGARAATTEGLPNRYITLTLPVLCWGLLACARFAPRGPGSVASHAALFLLLAFAWPNAVVGLNAGRGREFDHYLLNRDIRCGVPVSFLVEHCGKVLYEPNPPLIEGQLHWWRDLGYPPFGGCPPEPALDRTPVGWRVTGATPDADGWFVPAPGEPLKLTVELDREVPAVAIGYRLKSDRPVRSGAEWTSVAPDGTPVDRLAVELFDPGEAAERRLWLGANVTRLRLSIGGGPFRLTGVTGLEPRR